MPSAFPGRSLDRRRRWTLGVACVALLGSCDSPFAPDVQDVIRLEITPPVLTLVVGGNATLLARVYGAGDTLLPTAKVFWSTQNPTVVTVTQNGVVSAVAAGTAQIAASAGGLSRTIAVTVSQQPIALVRVSPPAGNVVIGGTLTLQGEALDGTGAVLPNRLLEWASSAPTIATVSNTGVVTGVAVGQATISATGEGKTGTAIVTVLPSPVVSITVQPNGGSLPAGGTLTLVATPRDANGQPLTGRTLQWRSSNDAVATVSSSGLLTAISPGTVTITVSAPGGGPNGTTPSATVNVTVLIQPVGSAVIVPSPASVQVGQTVALTVNLFDGNGEPLSAAGRTIAWSSSNASIASVNSSGTVTGVAIGTVTVTATVTTPGQPGSVQANVQLTVSNQPVVSVLVTPTPATVHVGYQRQFTAIARNAAGQALPGRPIVWTSSNQNIATVDAVTGMVTGVSQGSVQIRATSEGVQGVALVTIDLVPVSAVIITPASATLMPAQTVPLTAVPRDSAGNTIQGAALGGRTTAWLSSNTAVATVSGTGVVTAVAQGTSSVSATIGGTAGQSAITVNPLPSASQLAIVTQPSASVQNDVTFPVQPVIQLKDAAGANVATPGVVVQAAITAPGTGTLGGTTTATTNASGTATFSGLRITGLIGARTLTFTAGSLTPATSSSINVQPGLATQLALTTAPPSSANSGQVFSSPSVVQLRDVSGNDVPSSGVQITATVQPSAGVTLGGGTANTNGSGAATFGALSLNGPAGNYTLSFGSGSLTPAVSGPIALSAGSGSNLSITVQPSATVQSGIPFPVQPVIQLRDGSNNPVAQAGVVVSVAILTGGGTLGGTTTATTDPSGVATFSGLSISGTVGTRTLLFGASGYTTVASNAINVTPGAATALAVVTQPSSTAQSGAAFGSQPAIQVQDVSGNAVAQGGVAVSVSLNGAGGSLIGSTSATTSAAGLATFSGLGISGLVGTYSLSFAAGGLTGATSGSITLAAGSASQLTVSTQPGGASSGAAFTTQPAVQVRDAQGNPVLQSGLTVTASIASGAGATLVGSGTATTDSSGLAQFAGLGLSGPAGNYTLGFASTGLTSATSATIALGPGAPAQLAIVTQPAGATNGAAFTTQPAIQVRDAQGSPVTTAGITVTASVTGGGATLVGSSSAQTDGSGVATFSGLGLSGPAGNYTLDFSSSGVPTVTSGSIALAAGAASQLSIVTQPAGTVTSGSTLSTQPVIQLRDAGGNPVPQAGVNVTATISVGGASLTGTTTVATNASGVASFTDLGITGTAGTYTLTFGAGGLTPATSSSINVVAGAAAQLSIATQPSGASSGVAFTTQPVIQVRDAQGNPVSTAGINVTAAIASGAGATLIGSATATTNGSGVATFSGLGLSGPAGNYTLDFSAPSLSSVTSGTIALGAGAAAQLVIQTQPAGATNGVAFTTQPVIQVLDAQNNPVTQSGITVTASVNGGGASLIGSSTAQTNGSGIAAFSGLGLSGTVGNYTLNFSASGAPSVTSGTIALGAGAAAQLTMATQPSASVSSGSALATPPAVQVRDAGGNALSQSGVNVTVAISGSGASLTGSLTAATDGSGIATFTGLGITGLVGNYTLSFSSSGLTGTTSSSIAVTPGAPTQLTMTTQPPAAATSGNAFATAPAVQLRDAAGNAVSQSGVDVAASLNGPGGSSFVGSPNAATNGSGVATFTGLGISGPAGSYTITFSSSGLTSATSSSISLTLPPTQLAITTQPSATASSGAAFAVQPSVQLRDASNNPVSQSGVLVSAAITGGGATLIGTSTATTDGSGVATFSGLGISGTVGGYTLTFSSSGLTDAVSGTITLGPGAPAQVQITQQPSSAATNGNPLSTQPIVRLLDAQGNVTNDNGITVTASLNGIGGASGTLSGTTQVATFNGVASFSGSGLTITGTVGDYALTFTAAGVAGTATSGTISLGAGAAVQLTITTQPGGAQRDVPFTTQPVIQLRDSGGNSTSQFGATVTASVASGSGDLDGTASIPTNTLGVATFTNLKLDKAGSHSLRFNAAGIGMVISISFVVSP